ncbi:MAG: hypothetical protein J3Q66DRAFT_85774 [Benniella sp.]|nr:MAG: hypothetical protein J3Q66DRAFT_85774 [Benniella sp.]
MCLDAKRDRGRAEHDAVSQSPVTSDSERKDSANRHSRQSSLAQASNKQPYAAASRGKRMGEHSNAKTNPKDRTSQRTRDAPDDAQHMSGSSSVEGSFVSIVGNSSDDDDESSQKASGKVLREKSSKGTLPATTLPSKQTVLPCKKVWKMIYLKQRALAEEEAREKAEEMRKKAEEVFDLKMEEEDSVMDPIESSTMVDTPAVALPSFKDDTDPKAETEPEAAPSCEDKEPSEDTVMDNQPSMVEGDVLNLFREDVQPETCSTVTSKHASSDHGDEVDEEKPVSTQPPLIHQPVVVLPQSQDRSSAITETAVQDRPRTPQKLSLESYHARRLASSAVVASDGAAPAPATAIDTSATQVRDVEMSEPNPIATTSSSADRATEEATTSVGGSQEQKAEPAPAAPKVKLSLLEYQKQRQGASQRSTAPTNAEPSSEASKPIDPNPDTTKQDDSSAPEAKSHQDTDPVDVEMTERPQETTTTAEGEDQGTRDDYFQVGTSLPTPLIGLSSRAQAAGDYFPVQPFSPISLSAGPTPFSKMNLTSSPPRPSTLAEPQPQTPTGAAVGTQSPGKSPTNQRAAFNSSPKEPLAGHNDTRSSGAKLGSSPPPGWRTPRHQRGPSPPPPSAGAGANFRGNLTLSDHRNLDSRSAEGRLASPRYYGSPTDRPDRSGVGPLTSPPRERQHSLTSGGMPTSPFDAGFANAGNHYGYGEDSPSSFKRPGHMSSPTGPPPGSSGPREYYKSDERSRHRSMNGDDWGYGMDSPGYGGYRGPRGAPPPPPRDRERDRDRIRERDHERDRERERRDRFERRGDYFASGLPGGGVLGASGNNGNGLYGPSRGSGGPGGPGGMGGYGRRPSDYYGNQVREEGYGGGKKDGPPDPSLPY